MTEDHLEHFILPKHISINKVPSSVFWVLYDDLKEEADMTLKATNKCEGFYYNRVSLLNYYEKGMLYGIEDRSFDRKKPSGYGPTWIPAFLAYDEKSPREAMLWVREDFRRKNYATYLIKNCNIKTTLVLEKSLPFWESCGFDCIGKTNSLLVVLHRNIIRNWNLLPKFDIEDRHPNKSHILHRTLVATKNITKKDIIDLCMSLEEKFTKVFGNSEYKFCPESIIEGGLEMKKFPNKEGYKSIRLNIEWPHINQDTIFEEWRNDEEMLVPANKL